MAINSGRYSGRMVLSHEGERGIQLMQSLGKSQQQAAIIAPELARDIFERPGRRASLAKFDGLKADELSSRQMHLLRILIGEYSGNVDYDAALAQLELDEQGRGELEDHPTLEQAIQDSRRCVEDRHKLSELMQ